METFNFVVNYQCIIWCRNNLSIQAENREEAIGRLITTISEDPKFNDEHDGIENDWEYLLESEEIIDRFSADDPATIEVYEDDCTDDKLIWDNCNGYREKDPVDVKSLEKQRKEKVLKLLSEAVFGTEKNFFSQEELDEFATMYVQLNNSISGNDIANSLLLHYGNGRCVRCLECGCYCKNGWYINDIKGHVCSNTCLSSVLHKLFSENESNYRFEMG